MATTAQPRNLLFDAEIDQCQTTDLLLDLESGADLIAECIAPPLVKKKDGDLG